MPDEPSNVSDTAAKLVDGDRGLLAIDESNPTCNKRFANLHIPQNAETRRAYRDWIVATPGLADCISGVIVCDETLRQETRDGTPFVNAVAHAGLVPGIKVDTGAKPMAGHSGERVTEGLDGLRERLAEYSQTRLGRCAEARVLLPSVVTPVTVTVMSLREEIVELCGAPSGHEASWCDLVAGAIISRHMPYGRESLAISLVTLWLLGCHRGDASAKRAPTAALPSVSMADPTAIVWHYMIDPRSTARVEMQGRKERIIGGTTAASGVLDLAPRDLTQSRGHVRVDLSTFTTHTFGNHLYDELQSQHARAWLGVQVGEQTQEDMRWADFVIRAIDGASVRDLAEATPTSDGGDEVRTCTMTVHGDLVVHGHKVQKDDVVDVLFRYPTGAPADSKPMRIAIRSKEPLRVGLKDHDVRPRDPEGRLLEWTTRLISSVSETAEVTVDLGAIPEP